jgi:glycerol kinase
MTTILAIDQSTSATKAVLFDTQGQVVARATREHRQIYPQPGWVEHDAEEIWTNVLAVIREIAANAAQISDLVCLSITNQRETFVIFDRATGRPLHNAIVWQCRRGDPICQKLRDADQAEQLQNKTGLKLDTYFSGSKLKWLVENNPELAAKLQNGQAVVGTIDAYLVHRLTGGKVFASDHTNASRTLLFDVGRLRWDEQLCELFRVPIKALPEVRESAADFGETNAEAALPRLVPIKGVMGDSQASLFSQRCYQPGMAKATFGTGTSVLLNIGETFRVSRKGCVSALAWVWQGKPTYAFEGLINFSAATLEWLKNQLGLIQTTNEIEPLASSVPDNGGVYLVPAFAGLSAPYWAADARAAIVGMTAFTKREHVVRAAVESIGYQLRDVLEMMRGEAGLALRELRADGGPTRNRFLMQFTADMTGVELQASEVAESSAWGAAMCGLLGTGQRKSLADLGELPRESQSFHPQMKTELVQQYYDGWKKAVSRVL